MSVCQYVRISVCQYVRMSVYQKLYYKWETRFSPSIIKIEVNFLSEDSPYHEHISYKYFVRRSVSQATKGKYVNMETRFFRP